MTGRAASGLFSPRTIPSCSLGMFSAPLTTALPAGIGRALPAQPRLLAVCLRTVALAAIATTADPNRNVAELTPVEPHRPSVDADDER
ncbi:MAG: hypothetical protein JOZ91_01935 [Candidatus Eremiobacteraeota bacterium]|nr:hypothetical protein [Candidatus Eremiobacteraeota bacterium]